MIYREFQGKQLSLLGFGTMRLPLLADGKTVDEEQTFRMTDYALAHGVNYFDTAYPYHDQQSEIIIGKALARHPRESFYLATKYPGHQPVEHYDPAGVFERQLQKCGVEYFDFYLLHNVCENSMHVYTDPQLGIVDYFVEQKRLGRIRHLGFSSHAEPEALKSFLDQYGEYMEFCQIQLNYLDWTLQKAKEKYELLTARNIPVWVMEPVRGGKLAKLGEEETALLEARRPGASAADWAFRWLQGLPNVGMVLSGMSNLEQMEQNIRTFSDAAPLSDEQRQTLLMLAEKIKDAVPCTACRYCCDGCPQGLDIPMLIQSYNDLRLAATFTPRMRMESLPASRRPEACVACGQCSGICPQGINVPKVLEDFSKLLADLPTWKEICRQRELAEKQARENKG